MDDIAPSDGIVIMIPYGFPSLDDCKMTRVLKLAKFLDRMVESRLFTRRAQEFDWNFSNRIYDGSSLQSCA